MSYNNNNNADDGNPFYTEVPIQSSPSPPPLNYPQQPVQQQQQPVQQQPTYNQPQAIFTNTNVNFDDFNSSNSQPLNTTYQPNLQFQDFSHSNIGIDHHQQSQQQQHNKIGGGNSQVPQGEFHDTPVNINSMEGGGDNSTKYSFWQVQYYGKLFNVDSNEVGLRLIRSMIPIKFSFFNLIKENPDLYGPVWVATTLVFVIAVSSNLNEYFNSDHSAWEVDVKKLVYSAIAIYGYSVIIPVVLWGIFKWMKLGIGLLDMLCIYGYTLFIYIPASILCVVPQSLAQWIIVGGACLLSGVFLVTNVFTPLKEDFTKRGLIICGVIGALHAGLALVFKLYFFANNTKKIDI
eukprot:gene2429-2999_t